MSFRFFRFLRHPSRPNAPRPVAKSGVRRSDVRFGSLADICSAKRHVRFTPKSGHEQCNAMSAKCQ